MKKTYNLLLLAAALMMVTATTFVFTPSASAATPTLSLSRSGTSDSVDITVNGDANSGVILSYNKLGTGQAMSYLGTTNASGNYTTTIGTANYGITAGSSITVSVGGQTSAAAVWPDTTTAASGSFTLSQTAVSVTVGQSVSLTALNVPANSLYLSNSSNPPIANINISGNQITVIGLSYGSTVATVCIPASTTAVGTTNPANCASIYVTVSSTASTPLTFSMSSVTLGTSQSVPITISGGNGTYSVLNNSNSAAVQTSISGSTITLTANGSSGATSAITVCSSNMSSCGIINATISSTSTSTVTFSQNNPSLTIGQNLAIALSGGSNGSYYVSANSNANSVQATVSGSSLNLYGNSNGSATITVCSSSANCGWLTATVSYTSTGGPLALSQSSISLLAGQVLSVTVSGGTTPYSVVAASGSANIAQSSINGNIVTVSGINVGSTTINVCSAGGACSALAVTVNASGSGTPIAFSQNNVTLNTGAATAITMSGAGGYYVSNSTNQNIASIQITGSIAIISALSVGTTNVSICQSGGQCAILFISVSNNSTTTALPAFSQSNPTLNGGQTMTVAVSGGTGNSYYVAANSNPSAVVPTMNGTTLTLAGQASGTATIVVCASTSSCKPLTVTVNPGTTSSATPLTLSQASMTLTSGLSQTVTASGNGGYYLSGNSNPSVASVQIIGSAVTIMALSAGSTSASICQSGGQCATLAITVTSPATPPPSTGTVTMPTTPTNTKFKFTKQLALGDLNNDVTELQKRLTEEGIYKGPVTGKFGGQTMAAVKAYQKLHKIRVTGTMGPLTMAELNK